jgi:hypothetical protein
MGKPLHPKKNLEFVDGGTVAEQQSDLPPRFEPKQKHHHSGKGETRKRINNLAGISRVRDFREQRGKKHQRSGGGFSSELGSNFAALAALFLVDQELPLGLGDLGYKTLEKLSFLNPSLNLLTKFDRDI